MTMYVFTYHSSYDAQPNIVADFWKRYGNHIRMCCLQVHWHRNMLRARKCSPFIYTLYDK